MDIPVIEIGMFETLAVTVLVIYLGNWLRDRLPVLKQYCIPSAVVGGTLVAILICVLYVGNVVSFSFDSSTMNTFFYNIFFAASGCAASLSLLKKGGKLVIIFSVLAALLAALQNVLAVTVGSLMDMPPLLALMAGSAPLTGGHGNAASFGPVAEGMGAVGAVEVAVAAATFGLIAGCVLGGPMGRRLIQKNHLYEGGSAGVPADSKRGKGLQEPEQDDGAGVKALMDPVRSTKACFLLLLACGLGEFLFRQLEGNTPDWFSLPIHVLCMLGGILIRLALDTSHRGDEALYATIDTVGEISLALFVTMSIMTMKLWQLAELALPLITILALQLVLIWLFCTQITFRALGRNYDAAIMATGHSGFGLGAVPVSMAAMTAVCEKYRYSKIAFFVVPIIGGFVSNITNALIITAFMNFFA